MTNLLIDYQASKELTSLIYSDPILSRCHALALYNKMSVEEALEMMVITQTKAKQELFKKLQECINLLPMPPIIIKDKEDE